MLGGLVQVADDPRREQGHLPEVFLAEFPLGLPMDRGRVLPAAARGDGRGLGRLWGLAG